MKPLPNQMHLDTVIDHLMYPANVMDVQDTHKPAGVRLANMLNQYEARPSSELWSSIQSLALEILR